MKRYSAPASFDPATGTINASNIGNFDPGRVLAIVDTTGRALIYDLFTVGLGFSSVSGSTMVVETDTTGLNSLDKLLIIWDDDGILSGSAIAHNVVNVTTSPQSLPSQVLLNGATVKAALTNLDTVYVGGSSVTTNNGFPLAPNESLSFSIDNLSRIYFVGVSGDKLAWIVS